VADATPTFGIDLYWLPLGAGGHFVRLNGRAFEAIVATIGRRARRDLYHSALEVRVPEGRYTIEMAPAPDANGLEERLGTRRDCRGPRRGALRRRIRLFRYELRCWRDGNIPDIAEAICSPQHLTDDPDVARRLLDVMPHVPRPTWGRDELHAGEMWNSNSLTSWLLVRSDLDVDAIALPPNGRAPGWDAGNVVAHRQIRAHA
jgi:hypothetical protein